MRSASKAKKVPPAAAGAFVAIQVIGIAVPRGVLQNAHVDVRISATKNPDLGLAMHRRFYPFGRNTIHEYCRPWTASPEQAKRLIQKMDVIFAGYGFKKNDEDEVLDSKWYAMSADNIIAEVRAAARRAQVRLYSEEEKRQAESLDDEIARRISKVTG